MNDGVNILHYLNVKYWKILALNKNVKDHFSLMSDD